MATSIADYKASRTADVALPSGKVFTLRRPPLHVWKANGRIPDVYTNLTADALDAAGRAADLAKFGGDLIKFQIEESAKAQRKVAAMTPEDKAALAKFERDLVLESVVSPVLVASLPEGVDPDEVLTLEDLADTDFNFLVGYALNNSPDVPVPMTTGGTMPESTVRTFRQKPTRRQPASNSSNGRTVRRKAKR
jgi:hypothetical protein